MNSRKIALSLLLAFALLLSLCSCFDQKSSGGGNGGEDFIAQTNSEIITEGDFQIHFLELGNKYTGDCTYIRAGDVDILIDAGSKTSSISTIKSYLTRYITDNVLEYVIVTHAHEDHYAGFATSENVDSIFDIFECKTIIDFSEVENGKEEKAMYKNYIRERDAEIENGAVHYTAAEAVAMGGNFDLGNGISMKILDSYYYYNVSSSENNHSVCTLFDDGTNSYLFTGDLEAEGEEKLVEMNEIPEVKVYKAGHHGSKTSSSEALLSVIKPQIVCVCCCCGSPQYTDVNENQFPTQKFVDRVSEYTDAVYVTTLCTNYKEAKFESMNGNIVIVSTDGNVNVICSASSDKLKDTKWFKQNRTVPEKWQKSA